MDKGKRPIFTIPELRAVEQQHARDLPPLMERAGEAAARQALSLVADRPGPVLVLAGPGNNGGDAFVLARHLKAAGRTVILVHHPSSSTPSDAAAARAAWRDAGGTESPGIPAAQMHASLVVDGLFGIGMSRPLEGLHAEWVGYANAAHCPVLALDVPSGLDAATGEAGPLAVRATHTASFIALKPGLLTADGPDLCGEITVHDLGLDLPTAGGEVVSQACFRHCLRPRRRNSHKGSFGDAGVVGGAQGMVGAALLAARAALNLGSGRVHVGLLSPEALAVDLLQPELMMRQAGEVAARVTTLALGCGLGTSETAAALLDATLDFPGPLLLDADALNLVAADPARARRVAGRSPPCVLTPHPAEAARLLGTTTRDVQGDRLAAARALSDTYRACVVLKGCGSVLASPSGVWAINTSGNPGLATAGSGDVLSGMTLALLAQGWPAWEALSCAVHLHGKAAERCVEEGRGPTGLTAGELIKAARAIFNAWVMDEVRP